MIHVLLKRCNCCSRLLPSECFSVRKASVDGLSYKCKECCSEYNKERYKVDDAVRKAAKDRAAVWAEKNPDRRKEIAKSSAEKRAEQMRAIRAAQARERRKKKTEQCRLVGRLAAQRRRHRMFESRGFIDHGVLARLLKRAGDECVYCGATGVELTIDHFHPVSKGGSGNWGNLIPCCAGCNSSKRDKDGPEWIERRFGIDRLVDVYWRMQHLHSARLP